MDSSFLQKVTLIVTFAEMNFLFSWLRGTCFSMRYISFLEKCFIELKTVFVNTDQ